MPDEYEIPASWLLEWQAPEDCSVPQTSSTRVTLVCFRRELASEESPAHCTIFYRGVVGTPGP